jgi:hypothetical protein
MNNNNNNNNNNKSHDPIPGTDAINFTYADGRKTKLKNWGNKERLQSHSEYSFKKSIGKSFRMFSNLQFTVSF